MKTYPLFLDLAGQPVLLIGGGEQAAQKARLVLKTEARLRVFAETLNEELAAEVAAGRIERVTEPLVAAIARSRLVFVATGCAGADAGHAAVARSLGRFVNVVDRPELCDFLTPAIVDRDPVVVAIGTEGAAPVLARQIKTAIEIMLEPGLGAFAALAGRLRGRVAERVAPARRRAFWEWALDAPRRRFAGGDRAGAEAALEAAVDAGGAPARTEAPRVALVGAGPGSADLITLRGVERLQRADIVFYDRLVDPGVLELARRDAERVAVGKAPGAHAWPQERINREIVAAARRGLHVVRLKGGDPGIFARGTEEADALDAAGIAWEVVPGVTAASAAAADIGTFLTERGEIRSIVLTTGQTADGETPDWAEHARRGTAVAFYMAVSAAPRIADELRRAGVPDGTGIDIVERAGTPAMRHLRTTLGCLAYTVEAAAVQNPAILMLRWRRGAGDMRSTVVPFAEKRRADAHDGRTEADCSFEVAAHPH